MKKVENTSQQIKKLEKRALECIFNAQLDSGGFMSLSSESPSLSEAREYQTTFATSLLLSTLDGLSGSIEKDVKYKNITQRGIDFLLSQRSDKLTWNYWDRHSREALTMPYPDDLDDTFLALTAIKAHRPVLIDGGALARIAKVMTALEVKPGGPYRTWLIGDKASAVWRDIDLAVNANIGFFLSKMKVSLKGIESMIEQAIKTNSFTSPYYPSEIMPLYFIARFYQGTLAQKLFDKLYKYRPKNLLEEAATLSSLITLSNYSELTSTSVSANITVKANRLFLKSATDFKAHPTCIDPTINKKVCYSGSAAVTAALCLEAANKYGRFLVSRNKHKVTDPDQSDYVWDAVIRRSDEVFAGRVELANIFATLRDKILKGRRNKKGRQIILLAYDFARSLKLRTKEAPSALVEDLGLANLLGWVAYKIYDDFWDREGNPEMLAVANICQRELTELYRRLLGAEHYHVFKEIMKDIDSANHWETKSCSLSPAGPSLASFIPSYGDYSVLYKKSFGHALGPLVMLMKLGFTENSTEFHNLRSYFENYIIAKQLNDDAHDWSDDLKRGFVNSVSARFVGAGVLADAESINELKSIFWQKEIIGVVSDIKKHTSRARIALADMDIVKDKSYMTELLADLDLAADQALEERRTTIEFVEAYI